MSKIDTDELIEEICRTYKNTALRDDVIDTMKDQKKEIDELTTLLELVVDTGHDLIKLSEYISSANTYLEKR